MLNTGKSRERWLFRLQDCTFFFSKGTAAHPFFAMVVAYRDVRDAQSMLTVGENAQVVDCTVKAAMAIMTRSIVFMSSASNRKA